MSDAAGDMVIRQPEHRQPPVGPFTAVGTRPFTESGTSRALNHQHRGDLVDETVQNLHGESRLHGAATVFVSTARRWRGRARSELSGIFARNEVRAIFLTPGTNITILARRMNEED